MNFFRQLFYIRKHTAIFIQQNSDVVQDLHSHLLKPHSISSSLFYKDDRKYYNYFHLVCFVILIGPDTKYGWTILGHTRVLYSWSSRRMVNCFSCYPTKRVKSNISGTFLPCSEHYIRLLNRFIAHKKI